MNTKVVIRGENEGPTSEDTLWYLKIVSLRVFEKSLRTLIKLKKIYV